MLKHKQLIKRLIIYLLCFLIYIYIFNNFIVYSKSLNNSILEEINKKEIENNDNEPSSKNISQELSNKQLFYVIRYYIICMWLGVEFVYFIGWLIKFIKKKINIFIGKGLNLQL